MAMARMLAPIHLELAWLSEKIDAAELRLSEKIDAVELRLLERIEAVEASNARIWQMVAIVSLTFFFFIFSLKECRTRTDLVEQVKIQSWRLYPLFQGKIQELNQCVLFILVSVMQLTAKCISLSIISWPLLQ